MSADKLVISAKAIWPNVDKVIAMCGLVSKDSWQIWSDFDGNVLKFKDDGYKIYLNRYKKEDIKCGDIFIKSHPKNIISKSYWGAVVNTNVLCLMGTDGILRFSYFDGLGNWIRNYTPLHLGIELLSFICDEYLNEEYKETRMIVNIPTVKLSGHVDVVSQSLEEGIKNKLWPVIKYKLQEK